MLKVLLFSLLLAAVFAHDSDESHENAKMQAHCPDATSNSSVEACSMNCPNSTHCTTCSSDANCSGNQMCCQTNCGMQCVDPEYKLMCEEDDDCPGDLTCCEKCCVAECVKPVIPVKKGKEPDWAKGKSALNHDDQDDDDDEEDDDK